VLPKSAIGEAVTYATNQWPTLGIYLTDGRLIIDDGPAEQAARSKWHAGTGWTRQATAGCN
jgi:transposase